MRFGPSVILTGMRPSTVYNVVQSNRASVFASTCHVLQVRVTSVRKPNTRMSTLSHGYVLSTLTHVSVFQPEIYFVGEKML